MRRRFTLLSIVVLLALVVGTGYYALPRASGEQTPFIPGGISLVRPAVAQQTQASFLDSEAGKSAYYDASSGEINLSRARSAFRIVERETPSWIVGTVPVTGFAESEDPHVFVHQQGWIIAYYDKDSPVGRTIDWLNHGVLAPGKLEMALEAVANSAGLAILDAGFYDFRYPNATEWLIIVDDNSFTVDIPG